MTSEVQQYLSAASEDFQPLFRQLQALILEHYPASEIAMSYRIPTFKTNTGWVALGFRKDGVSLYTCGGPHIEQFRARHPKIKSGVGCLNFRLKDDISEEDLKQVIRQAMKPAPKPDTNRLLRQ